MDNNKKIEVPVPVAAVSVAVILLLLLVSAFLMGKGAGVKEASYTRAENGIRYVRNEDSKTEAHISYAAASSANDENSSSDLNACRFSGSCREGQAEKLAYSSSGSGGQVLSDVNSADASSETPCVSYAKTAAFSAEGAMEGSASDNQKSAALAQSNCTDREKIRQFFLKLETTLESGKTWSDPNSAAETVLKSFMNGDSSELDGMMRNMERIEMEVGSMETPPECADYKSKVLSSFSHSASMMKRFKEAVQNGDMSALTSISNEAATLKREAEEADMMMKGLKARYGIDR